ncbi:MAG: pyridoxamine 5'-phosphate oxidase [Gammaproteobacteria bacterium]|jgi:pyridoxamine 5'-phosphate oxidase|nr:pyridoxamine 5'-phosphate oxidase [Gammaproteobacteria bacterium]
MDIGDLRQEYTRLGLRRQDLADNPFTQFELWFTQAREGGVQDPNAMSLATVDEQARPALRTVLLKFWNQEGFVFYTNFGSAKARHMANNPEVALLFLWLSLERQVIIRGRAEKVSTTESVKYFLSRPRGSQLGAWVSQQSSVVSSRSILEAKLEEMKQKFANRDVSLPSFWGGYRVVPRCIEFWQGRPNRLHDRFMYTREQEEWKLERLAP